MTTAHDIDWPQVLAERLTTTHPDVLRELLATFIHTLMGAEADALCGAGYGQRSSDRTNSRNGYRHRQFDTRTGSLDLAIPKLRQGSYFPDWLLERRKRAERALTTVVATCYLLGVSTRRMDKLVETLGITSLSKSQVSVMAKELDTAVEAFRTRPLDAGPYTFMAADALVLKVREAGRVVNVHALIAVGVNAEGYREILGIDVSTAEDGARLADVSTIVDCARPVRGGTGHQRCARGATGRDRGDLARMDTFSNVATGVPPWLPPSAPRPPWSRYHIAHIRRIRRIPSHLLQSASGGPVPRLVLAHVVPLFQASYWQASPAVDPRRSNTTIWAARLGSAVPQGTSHDTRHPSCGDTPCREPHREAETRRRCRIHAAGADMSVSLFALGHRPAAGSGASAQPAAVAGVLPGHQRTPVALAPPIPDFKA